MKLGHLSLVGLENPEYMKREKNNEVRQRMPFVMDKFHKKNERDIDIYRDLHS